MTLQLIGVTLSLGGRSLIEGLSLDVADGVVATVMGPSGAGKSTLLDFVGGHLQRGVVARGRVILDGRDVTALPAERRRIGLLFQDAMLFPHLSVADNLAFGLPRGTPDRADVIARALDSAGLAGFGPRDPATLSGGQRGRVALMRTLLAEPRAVLLDEPFSRLDAGLRTDFRAFVLGRIRERGIPALMVTHDAEDAAAAGGPVVTLG